jgi:hypothetical protein
VTAPPAKRARRVGGISISGAFRGGNRARCHAQKILIFDFPKIKNQKPEARQGLEQKILIVLIFENQKPAPKNQKPAPKNQNRERG